MKVQAMPAQPQARSETAGTQAGNGPKEEFLSILRKRTEGRAEKAEGGEKEPVKKAEKTEQDTKEGTKEEANGSINAADVVQNASLTAEALLENLSGQNVVQEISEGAKQLYRQSSIMSGTKERQIDPAGSEPLIAVISGGKEELSAPEKIPSGQEETAKASPPEGVFAEALEGRTNQLKEASQPKAVSQPRNEEFIKDLQLKSVKTAAAGDGARNEGAESGREGSGKENSNLVKWFSLNRSSGGERFPENVQSKEKQNQNSETVSLDELQKKAEQNTFLPFERLVGAKLSGGAMTQVMSGKGVTDATPLPDQLRAGIEQGISKQLNQFTIRLKPEGLGEILVHMTSTGGKIALSIGVSNLETQKLLTSEMMHLKETMEPLNAEIQEIYHNSQGGMEMMNYEQGFFRNQQKNNSETVHRHMTEKELEEEDAGERPEAVGRYAGHGGLSAYV